MVAMLLAATFEHYEIPVALGVGIIAGVVYIVKNR
jgi:hypothetical protein